MRRYLLSFAIPTFVILAVTLPLSLFFQPLSGDLTRIGGYAERDFGWNAAPPAIPILANDNQIGPPNALLLGDSFSASNSWQSVLSTALDIKILSYPYKDGCIDGWVKFSLSQPAQIVAIETIERAFVGRFGMLQRCDTTTFLPYRVHEGLSATIRPRWAPELHFKQTWRTALNTLHMNMKPQLPLHGEAVNVPLRAGCARFSNRRADRLLYYRDDEMKVAWSAEARKRAIANVLLLQQQVEAHGKRFALIVVPDKLTTYQPCLLNDPLSEERERINITRELIAAGVNTVDLVSPLRKSATEIVDLYLPNDTHFSTSGYIKLAELVRPLFKVQQPSFLPAK